MSSRTETGRTVGTALLVCLACAAGAAVGDAARFPHIGAAFLYLPYAVVTAALLFSPPRRWWIYLLASTAGSYWPHRIHGASLGFFLLAEVANYARALLAAWGVRRFANPRADLETLRDMTVFMLFAVVLAPVAGAFIGAGVVTLYRGSGSYCLAWAAWLLSNVLTGLTLFPIILIARGRLATGRALRVPSPWRVLEGGLLLLALLSVGGLVLLGPATGRGGLAEPLYAPLPLLLWAAVRFGPAGTSASLSVVVVLAIAGILHGRGPFVTDSPSGDFVQLQLFLCVTSLPLLLLSALLQERQRTGAALRASQQQYESVIEDQPDLVCRFRPDGTLTFVNGACCRRSGRSRQELIGASIWSLIDMETEEREVQEQLLAALVPERPMATWEQQRAAGCDESRWEHWRVRALFDRRGRLVDYQAVGRDVTERKRAENQHAILQAQRAAAEALREADRRKNEFLAMVAHELRNPLAPIAMAVEILRQLPASDDDMSAAREIIGRQTAQLGRLVDDLLDVARITSGTIQLRLETVDLSRVVASALEISRPLIAARQIDLVTNLPAAPLFVRGDAVRLAQLFSNLLNNSAKYSPMGGRVELTIVEDGGDLVVTVKDAGVGIPVEMLDRVFEPFTQVDSGRDGALGGLGLGLALAKRLVELHGGTIAARSQGPGTGSELVVRLPASLGGARAEEPTAPARPEIAVARSVLVVDDVADVADTLASFLRLQGHRVYVAHDGRTALELAELIVPEVVFVDVRMSDTDGLEIARRLRRRREARSNEATSMLLVAMTGFGQPEDRARSLEAGFDHHLVKPLDPRTICALLAIG
jgi:PAS domain S-box-containing protein